MATQILEGTFAEVLQQLNKLDISSEKWVRAILETFDEDEDNNDDANHKTTPPPDLLRTFTQ